LGTSVAGITNEALQIMKKYTWPGNIRELENVLERAMNISDDHMIYPEHLPMHLKRAVGEVVIESGPKSLEETILEAEKEAIKSALIQAKGNKVQASKALGIHRSVLYKKMTKYNM
jgi:transcriptional regulator with PAS, ATPase and Fis domain